MIPFTLTNMYISWKCNIEIESKWVQGTSFFTQIFNERPVFMQEYLTQNSLMIFIDYTFI